MKTLLETATPNLYCNSRLDVSDIDRQLGTIELANGDKILVHRRFFTLKSTGEIFTGEDAKMIQKYINENIVDEYQEEIEHLEYLSHQNFLNKNYGYGKI